MIEKPESELSFVTATEPLSTVEVDADSVPRSYFGCDSFIVAALKAFDVKRPGALATVYVLEAGSVNFREPTNSVFFGVAGSQSDTILETILREFKRVPGIRARTSDAIAGSSSNRRFHLQGGAVWVPSDPFKWASYQEEKAVEQDWGDDDPEVVETADGDDMPQNGAPQGGRPPVAGRIRAARADASVSVIRTTIEKRFGLPEGSVALCGPDGKPLRGNAKIGTLRSRWE